MFTSKQNMTAREVSSAHGRLTSLLASRDNWYDGTVKSVDTRVAALTNALGLVIRASETDGSLLREADAIRVEKQELLGLRHQLLNPAPAKVTASGRPTGPLSERGRRFIATEVGPFLADNVDALGDSDEMDTRANDHAEIETVQLPVTEAKNVVAHFRQEVARRAREATRFTPRAPRTAASNAGADFPDEMLFF